MTRALNFFLSILLLAGTALGSEEPFRGALPPMTSIELPKNVSVVMTQIQASGEPVRGTALRDALWIQLWITSKNIPAVSRFFGVGVDKRALANKLQLMLGARSGVWIDLHDLFSGWIREMVNRFPYSTNNRDWATVVREFYHERESRPEDVGTKSVATFEKLLNQKYCRVPVGIEPRYGDVLYLRGVHAARFVLKDPVSERWIGLSLQTGDNTPYRFWWVDEDFGLRPFNRRALEVWRRCRQ